MTTRWYQIAVREMGQQEIAGDANNPRILTYQAATGLGAKTDEVPWCGSFVAWVMGRAGIKYDRNNAARAKSWLQWGTALKSPVDGCVVILNRGSNLSLGHVTFFGGWVDSTHGQFYGLGGNQSNRVSIAKFNTAQVAGYRWPEGEPLAVAAQPLSKSGVLHGAVVAGGASLVTIASNATTIQAGLESAQNHFNEGTVLGAVAGLVGIIAVLYIIYSRVQGTKDEKALAETSR